MLKEITYRANNPEGPGSARISRVKTYKTAAGPLFLQSCCSPELVEGLQADEGLRAFARLPEREHQLLLALAGWWQGIENAYEVAIEVSPPWRNLDVAHQLLSLALDFESVEEYLILGLGFSWHWDYAGLGMSRFRYRELIARLFAAHGFAEYLTSEPNIRMDPANILVARLGRCLGEESMNRFFERLLQSETLLGL